MGLSIHYNGRLNNPQALPRLIEEVTEISDVMGWKYELFGKELPDGSFAEEPDEDIYGLLLSIPYCEPVFLCFLSNGLMVNPMLLGIPKTPGENEDAFIHLIGVKTQYAGIENHKKLVHLFKYLNKKYFADFRLTDEGNYWETGNEQVLEKRFKLYNDLMDTFTHSLSHNPKRTEESYEAYFMRLLRDYGNKDRK